MKRTALLRRSELKRTKPLRSRPRRKPAEADPEARAIFTEQTAGYCECGCGRFCMWRENHHCVPKEAIKRERRPDLLWDLRNRLRLHPFCHERHTNCSRKLSISVVPDSVCDFACDLFGGDERAAIEVARLYGPELELEGWCP